MSDTTVGYIVLDDDRTPMVLCDDRILYRGWLATMFRSRGIAKRASERTLRYAEALGLPWGKAHYVMRVVAKQE